jgi:hypothetical protein
MSVVKEEIKVEVEVEVEKVEEKEVKEVEKETSNNYLELVNLVVSLLSSSNDFNEFITKYKITLNDSQSKKIKNILGVLNAENINNQRPLNLIVNEIMNSLIDKKLELYEMPKIINVIHDSLKNVSSINVSTNDIGTLIKFILVILIETKIVKLSTNECELIINIIDTSIMLLYKTVQIKLPNKCICF